jgi:hypothetical protein
MSHLPYIVVPSVVWLLFCCLVGRAAASFGRRPSTWFLLALLLSPLAAYVLLLVAGDARSALALREKEERLRQRYPDRADLREAALNEMDCPHCGAPVNPVTGDGLHTTEAEPWLLICDRCQATIEPDL